MKQALGLLQPLLEEKSGTTTRYMTTPQLYHTGVVGPSDILVVLCFYFRKLSLAQIDCIKTSK